MPTCPNGHQSNSDDWCEVCGHRMAGVPPLPPPPPGGGYSYPAPGSPPPAPGGRSGVPDPGAELCPQCRTPREGAAPFCEECRWNFLTNTATSYTPAAPRPPAGATGGPGVPGIPGGPGAQSPYGGPGGPGGPGGQNPGQRFPQPGQGQPGGPGPGGPGHDPFEYQSSRPSQMNRPAEPIPPGPGAQPYGGPQGFGDQGFGDPSRQAAPSAPGGPGAPQQAYTQQPSPPPYTQGGPPRQGGPQQGGQAFGGVDDDWVIPPPSSGAPGGHGGPGGPSAQGGPAQGAGYGYPQPGATQAPPGPGYQQQPPPQQQQQQSLSWSATIAPDREYFMAMMQRSGPEAAGLNLPAYSPELQRPLLGNQITIGRRRHSTGESPDIDLSVPPEDPGVSHQHAVLVQQPDSTWAVVDQNSTNGTTVNGGEEPIQPFVPVPLQDGDRVHVGAWTTITIRRG
ncbi:FHA domain-containing protein [Streptomyces sp. NPDC127077]|uniref:FHA domain-containing protein n=1 Tax=Streptomyces sp. NPDC127077 TaxID=3347131 RepID=UPI003654E711